MITIRAVEYTDCGQFLKWENDPNVIRNLSISQGKTMEEMVRELIARESDDSMFDFAVLENGRMIGRAFLSRYDRQAQSIDITRIYIGEEADRGKGYGTAMLEVLLAFCFEELDLHRVTLDFYDGNPAQKVYRRLGFVDEGVARDAGYKDGRYHNFNLMSMLRKEYENR